MAVSGTVPARARKVRFDPSGVARRLRRLTWGAAAVLFTWFLLEFGTRWVPTGMSTLTEVPAGSWCVVDRWSAGLRVGSDVFVETPAGMVLSRVSQLDATTVTIEHTNPTTIWPDSRSFGPLPRRNVLCTVMVVFLPDDGSGRGR